MSTAALDLERIVGDAEEAICEAASLQALAEVRARFLGRKGSLSAVLRGIGGLAGDERASIGKAANAAKLRIEALVAARRDELAREGQERELSEHRLDVTLPGFGPPAGHLHPTTQIEREMCDFFVRMGYGIEDGPEVETDWNNFGGLNFPEDHPARDLQDTFFVPGGKVLRTHTSNVQIRAMTGREPPFRFICPGRVYRHDLDGTHYPMFHQIEAVCVDESTSLADLKGTLYAFARHLFGAETEIRFRAHFFPFTEPSAEIDIRWGGRWLEWGGCGMVHPRVLANCGIDPDRYQGFAFGMGVDRTAMIRWHIPNIQLLFDGDVRSLEQF